MHGTGKMNDPQASACLGCAPALHPEEAARQAALDALGLLDKPGERRFDAITEAAREAFGVEIALVTLVDRDRQWFKSAQGLALTETGRDISFCGHAILAREIFQVENACQDERFSDNPLVTGPPYVRFYAGIPVHTAEGLPLGTLCLIDSKPRRLNSVERMRLRSLAGWLEAELRVPATEKMPFNAGEIDARTGRSRWLDEDAKCWNAAAGDLLLAERIEAAAGGRAGLEVGVIQLRGRESDWKKLADAGLLADARMGFANMLRKSLGDRAFLFTAAPDLYFYVPRKPGRIGSVIRLPLVKQLLANMLAILGISAQLDPVRAHTILAPSTRETAATCIGKLADAARNAAPGESVDVAM